QLLALDQFNPRAERGRGLADRLSLCGRRPPFVLGVVRALPGEPVRRPLRVRRLQLLRRERKGRTECAVDRGELVGQQRSSSARAGAAIGCQRRMARGSDCAAAIAGAKAVSTERARSRDAPRPAAIAATTAWAAQIMATATIAAAASRSTVSTSVLCARARC